MLDLITGYKWLSVGRLTELLGQLPSDAQVCVNSVGNLFVARGVTSGGYDSSIGFVDFAGAGSMEFFAGMEGIVNEQTNNQTT